MVLTRVDKAGRLVIPLELRRALRLEEGGDVEVARSPEGLVIRRAGPEVAVVFEDGLPVVSLGGPSISNDEVLEAIDRDRGARWAWPRARRS